MFLRPLYRERHGRREAFWALVESYRTERGHRQRTVAYLGRMDEAGRLGVEQLADPQPLARQGELFDEAAAEPRFVEIQRGQGPRNLSLSRRQRPLQKLVQSELFD